ncbi:RNA polymerase sigma factor [Radiobacillus deserti]|uniref:Sigma-70 family RNA polymerase sigma factor n=1 Tax=Radiobacillus deserti TaxID=2594883 RepID=A0A516KF01_9BACI|nr:sigma-70 family RNA polymerase sigma factor [Radiobacillus deserti]QDP39973.1 sigma-70 family RNA polymerase sigma factor [Radiobacillus deserti]
MLQMEVDRTFINFEEIYKTYYQKVLRVSCMILKNPSLAEDVAQETFIKAFKKMDMIRDTEKISGWLSTIASRTAIDFLRKEKKISAVPIEEVVCMKLYQSSLFGNVENELDRLFTEDEIKEEMKALSPKLQAVFQLKYMKEMKDEEIAKRLKLSKAAVKSRLCRARKHLKGNLEENEQLAVSVS